MTWFKVKLKQVCRVVGNRGIPVFLPKGGKNVVILYNIKNNYNGTIGKCDSCLGLIRG